MAGIDPRRSSRARTTQSQSQISSTTSSTSGRAERNSRHFSKGGSPQKSTSTGSLSSEPPEESITADDPFATQRHTRRQGKERDRAASKAEPVEMANGDDDVQDEDEAVRCICGYDEYPGPPPFDEDSKNGLRDGNDIDPIFATDVTDDAAGFFVQCDICKVWQHGACVGIMTEESSPDEYFCEECRKDFHKIYTASNGQRYSHYIPLKRTSRAASRATSLIKEGTKSPPKEKETRSGRNTSANQTASKRRSTMNSREAAYDEAEALRKAIEASKEEALGDGPAPLTRRAKRGRSDSEEKLESAKRQKTTSRSSSPSFDQPGDESDEAGTTTRNGVKSRARNSGTSRAQVEKPSEKEERERQRLEAANKRKGRAERRRADGTASTILVKGVVSDAHADTDSDPSEELPLAARMAANKAAAATAATAAGLTATPTTTTAMVTTMVTDVANTTTETQHQLSITESAPASNQPSPDTPPASAVPSKFDKKRSHKKKGRNQHTRDKDGHDEESPARSQSRDIQKDEQVPSTVPKPSGEATTSKPHSKAKGGMNSKINMTDMKRRVAALLDFISRTQVELAGETLPEARAAAADILKANNDGITGGESSTSTSSSKNAPQDGAQAGASPATESAATGASAQREFKELNCIEMMDSLTRRLVKWQQEYST
ncbi:putative histone deacetylase complex subunit cti6 [Naviculisporaceae sp. PSN 640]